MSAASPAEALARELGAPSREVRGAKIIPMMCERHESRATLDREGWLFELKLDGVRIIADKTATKAGLSYRKQRDATDSYPEIATALAELDTRCVLDGEIVAFDASGRPDFQLLAQRFQSDPKRARKIAGQIPVVYVVFDCLAIGPYDLRGFPLEARKEILKRLLPADGLASGLVRHHPTFERGGDLFRFCEEHGLEGVVAKKLGSPYRPGERTSEWLKIKREHDCELVVIGWTEGESARGTLGALDIASYEGERLVYRGKVGSGLSAASIMQLLPMLKARELDAPTAMEGAFSEAKKRYYCRPEIVVSVRYGMVQRDGILRFPTYRGLRPDMDPKDCSLSNPA